MNFYCSTVRTAIFVNNVFALRGILNDKGDGLKGVMTLLQNEVRKRVEDVPGLEVVETLASEEDRVTALEKWFEIPLSKSEARAIRGLPTELVPPRSL